MSVTDEIKARLDIVAYIQQYATLKKAGRNYKACCPFHSEKTPSFTVDPDRQTWRCFGACATGGDIFTFAMRQHGWTFTEALQELGKQAGVQTRDLTPEQKFNNQRRDKLQGLLSAAADFYHAHLTGERGELALVYAREKRGFTDETIMRFRMGYAPAGWQNILDELTALGYSQDEIIDAGLAIKNDSGRVYDRFRNRLMIPIRDERGRVVGFGARALDPDDNPKYMNSPQSEVFDKSRILFGLDTARTAIRDSGTVVIVEGYMDAIQAQQAGFYNVVAQMGTALTETQIALIAPRLANKIILALDADSAGQNATLRSLEVARQTLQADYAGRLTADIRILQIPGAKDPDDLIRETPEQWQGLTDAALPVADYVIDVETAQLPRNPSLQERQAVALRILPILLASENDMYRNENLQRLAMRLRMAEGDLLAWAHEQKTKLQEQKRAQKRQSSAPQTPAQRPPDDSPLPPVHDTPPADYENMEIPDHYGMADYGEHGGDYMPDFGTPDAVPDEGHGSPAPASHNPVPMPPPRNTGMGVELEMQCLKALLNTPDLIYQINRKFRELAGDDEALLKNPLSELGVEDFTHGDYRALIQLLKLALRQDDLSVIDFLDQNLDAPLQDLVNTLKTHEAEAIRERIKGRYDGDAADTWKLYEKRILPYTDHNAQAVQSALRLRRLRLDRDAQEFQYLQAETDPYSDEALVYMGHVALIARTRNLIDHALKESQMHF